AASPPKPPPTTTTWGTRITCVAILPPFHGRPDGGKIPPAPAAAEGGLTPDPRRDKLARALIAAAAAAETDTPFRDGSHAANPRPHDPGRRARRLRRRRKRRSRGAGLRLGAGGPGARLRPGQRRHHPS